MPHDLRHYLSSADHWRRKHDARIEWGVCIVCFLVLVITYGVLP